MFTNGVVPLLRGADLVEAGDQQRSQDPPKKTSEKLLEPAMPRNGFSEHRARESSETPLPPAGTWRALALSMGTGADATGATGGVSAIGARGAMGAMGRLRGGRQ